MTILFCGSELDDFLVSGGSPNLTALSSQFRNTYARFGIQIFGASATNWLRASFAASSALSATCRIYPITLFTSGQYVFSFTSGGNVKLRFKLSSSAPSTIVLEKYDGTTSTVLATSTLTLNHTAQYRIDIIVDYQVSGRVRLYVDQTLFIDYSGDVTVTGITTLDALLLAPFHVSATTTYSEVIVCTQDSRTLSLVTLAPNAAGTTNTFTSGAYTDIDENTASDTDVAISATTGQILQVNCTGMPTGWSNLSVVAVKNLASAAKGATGPSKLAIGVRTGGTDYYETATPLDGGYTNPPFKIWELNPVTGVAWTTTEIDALQLAYKSET